MSLNISVENLPDYLRSRRLTTPDEEPLRVVRLSGGVSGTVLKVTTAGRRFVVKQALPRLDVAEEWLSDPARIFIEHRAMGTIRPGMPDGSVPAVMHADRENFLILMECAPEESENWKENLLAGKVEPAVAAAAGSMSADIHHVARIRPEVRAKFEDTTFFHQLRVDPFHIKLMSVHPDLKPRLQDVVDRMAARRVTMVHGDYSPKNILVCGPRLILLDYEVAHWGDPAFDVSFCLGHLLLKAVRDGGHREKLFACAREFLRGYRERFAAPGSAPGCRSATDCSADDADVALQTAVLMLSRVDAKSRVHYLSEPQRDFVRGFARSAILEPPPTTEALLRRLHDGTQSQRP
jgi:5-methylthioribose kinase